MSPRSSREVELKYTVRDADAARALVGGSALAGYRAGPWRTVFVVDRYVDTPTGALARAGYGARVRRVRGQRGHVVTMKGGQKERARTRAVHDRMELEGPAGPKLGPTTWPESAARSLIESTIGGEPLRTLFVLDQRREERDLFRDESQVATLSLDEVTVRRLGRSIGELRVLEVEAAAGSGDALDVLSAVAAALEETDALVAEARSKEELALAMLTHGVGARSVRRPPARPGIVADEPLTEAGRKVLRMHLLRMIAAEPAVRAASSNEALKKMRVATRRMRAAWRVFGGAYRPRLRRRYVDELRAVAAALGVVRDVDVQIELLATYAAALPAERSTSIAPLHGEWQRRRSDGHQQLLDLLGSSAYDRFVADYLAFVETPRAGVPTGARASAPERARHAAASRIWRAYERLGAHDPLEPGAHSAALHALRIDAKRMRYTLEFLREILPDTTDLLVADLVALQDALGLLNDAQVAADMTRTWLVDVSPNLARPEQLAAGAYVRHSEQEVARLTRAFRRPWRRVSGVTFRRRLGHITGSL